jgi:hypothetical protein
MNTYVVLYRNNGLSLLDAPFGFRCQAENADHAEDQCLDAEPDADIVWVVQTDDYQAALDDYYETCEGFGEDQ